MQFADAAMTYFSTADGPLGQVTGTDNVYSRKSKHFRLVAGGGAIRIEQRKAEGTVDPRAGEVGLLSHFTFKGHEYGMLSPIVLDLDNDGIELVKYKKSHARFDMNGDGVRDRTGWVGRNDGFLVIDRNLDGKITSNSELTFGSEDPDAMSSLEALGKLDSNRDGKLDITDSRFGELRVWKDANGNGVTDAGEMITLGEAGIESIGLGSLANEDEAKLGSNMVRSTATFTRVNGSVGTVGDVALAFRPGSDQAGQGILDLIRQHQLFGGDEGRGFWNSLFAAADGHRGDELSDALPAQPPLGEADDQAAEAERVGASLVNENLLAMMAQDLASFGVERAASLELRRWHESRPIDLFAA
jgi:hypothetical protein